MKRNPIEKRMKEYFGSIRIRKTTPRLFYETCCKCHMEYKKEPMYKCYVSDDYYEMTHRYMGCQECFSSEQDFRAWLEDKKLILTEKDWYYKGELCLPVAKAIRERIDKNDEK